MFSSEGIERGMSGDMHRSAVFSRSEDTLQRDFGDGHPDGVTGDSTVWAGKIGKKKS